MIVNLHCHCDVLKRLCLFVSLFVFALCVFIVFLLDDVLHPDWHVHNFIIVEAIVNFQCHCDVMKRLCLFVCCRSSFFSSFTSGFIVFLWEM